MRIVADTNVVVSGDKRLRNLKTYQGIRILSAAEAVTLLPREPTG